MRADLFALHADLEERHWWFRGRRTILDTLVRKLVPPGAGSVLVDVGCGTGANLAALAGDYDCVGVDASDEAIRLARERFPGVRFVSGFAPEDVACDVARASMILFMDVLEHVRDDVALFSSVLAAAPAGAHALITVPAEPALWSEHDESFGHFRRYGPGRLAALWQDLPVTVRLLSHFNTRLYLPVKLVRTLGRLRGRASGRGGTDLSLPPGPVNRMLEAVFAGEAGRLAGALDGHGRPYARGVSMLALVRREPGTFEPRPKPADLAPDLYDPETGARP